jgi:Restriction endonuclease
VIRFHQRLLAMKITNKQNGAAIQRMSTGIQYKHIGQSCPLLQRRTRSVVRSIIVREFQGAIGAHPIHAGLIVTNTSFTSDAHWFAREHAKLVRLRDFSDIRRWLLDRFDDGAEWRELPRSIELCPGVTVRIR